MALSWQGKAGETTNVVKTTFDPKGNVVHVKDKTPVHRIDAMLRLSGEESRHRVQELRATAAKGGEGNVVLTREALARILERHASGELATEELTELASELEANDEIDYEPDAEAAIADVLFELSTPEINGMPTIERSRALRDGLVTGHPHETE
jgi:hypothetical protein